MNTVHPKVQLSLRKLLEKYQGLGVDVFLFGSVAETWPDYRTGADFDIGFTCPAGKGINSKIIQQLEADVVQLPTIRPIDLVDFRKVSASFAETAMKDARRML